MTKIAFDPGAQLHVDLRGTFTSPMLVEATLEALDDGSLALALDDELGDEIVTITLRADFLDAAIAARAREAAA
jgi:hypothetical protein